MSQSSSFDSGLRTQTEQTASSLADKAKNVSGAISDRARETVSSVADQATHFASSTAAACPGHLFPRCQHGPGLRLHRRPSGGNPGRRHHRPDSPLSGGQPVRRLRAGLPHLADVEEVVFRALPAAVPATSREWPPPGQIGTPALCVLSSHPVIASIVSPRCDLPRCKASKPLAKAQSICLTKQANRRTPYPACCRSCPPWTLPYRE